VTVLSLALVTNAPAQETDLAARLTPETFTLDNGMDVVVIPDHRVPVVTHMVWYRIGSADEKPGKSGLAHFLEHLMFKGTKKVEGGEFAKTVSRNGGQNNAFTSYDFTAYFQRIALDRLPLLMEMEADRMVNLTLNDETVYPERDVVLEELSMRTGNNPAAQLGFQISAALYQNHHYGIPLGGWRHETGALTTEDALDWYKTYYAPNNAILIVAGDITAEQLKPLAEKYYGRLKPRKVPERARHTEPPQIAARQVVLEDARVRQPSWSREYLAPSANSGEGNESVSLEVLAYILGGSNNSRLFKRLVIEEGKAAGAYASYFAQTLNDTTFSLGFTPSSGASLDEVEALIEEEIARLLKDGVTDEEIGKTIKTLQSDAIYALDSQMGLSINFGLALTTGRSVEDIVSWPARIGTVTADDVNAVAKKVLDPKRSVTGQLLPQGGAQS